MADITPDEINALRDVVSTIQRPGTFPSTRSAVLAQIQNTLMDWRTRVERPEQVTTATRAESLRGLEHALTLALQAMADNDCCADPDDPDWRGAAIEQFRADLIGLGVEPSELDAAGISL